MDDYFDNLDSTELNLKYFTQHHQSIYQAYEKYGQLIHEQGGPLDEKTCWLIKVALSTECQYPRALRTHILKALNCGCTKEEIEHSILLVAPSAGFPKTMAGILVLRQILAQDNDFTH